MATLPICMVQVYLSIGFDIERFDINSSLIALARVTSRALIIFGAGDTSIHELVIHSLPCSFTCRVILGDQ